LQKLVSPLLSRLQRFDFPPQGIVARAGLVQICRSLVFFAFQRCAILQVDA
jgi:hypothetical protein